MKQFGATNKVNNWTDSEKASALVVYLRGEALEVLQTGRYNNYNDLVPHLKMRFGDKQVYQAQLRNKEQMRVYNSIRLTFSSLGISNGLQDFMEQLTDQVFINDVRDCKTLQALRLAKPCTCICHGI